MNIKVPSKDPRTFVPRALQDSGLANLTLYNYLWNENICPKSFTGFRFSQFDFIQLSMEWDKRWWVQKKGRERKGKESHYAKSNICGIRSIQHLDKPNLQQHNLLAFINRADNF